MVLRFLFMCSTGMSQFFGPGWKVEAAVLTDCFGIGDDGEGGGRSGGNEPNGTRSHRSQTNLFDFGSTMLRTL